VEIKILSPNRQIYQGKSNKITLPGERGQFQILENHADIFALLSRGEIIIGKRKKIPILSGILEFLDNKLTIIIEE